nr:glycoside hydrolase family 95 protein [Sphingomonas jejuensis]
MLALTAAATIDVAVPAIAGQAPGTDRTQPQPNRLWYRQPARMWLEALPVGNGRLGAMVSGGVRDDVLQLNEATWWAGQPYDPVNPAARAALPRVRELIFEGRIREAHALADEALIGRPSTQMPYQSAGSLLVRLLGVNDNDAENYERELDLDAAVATARFDAGGRRYRREVFASAVDQVLVVRLSCDQPGAIDAEVQWRSSADPRVGADAQDSVLTLQRNGGSAGVPGGLSLASRAKLLPRGGRMERVGASLVVRGADELIVLVALATDHRRFDLVGGDPAAITRDRLDSASRKSFASLLAEHQADHRRLFRAASLDLGRSPAADLSTDARVAISRPADDPALAALYFAFARYLMIACSRAGGQPANLQGMWNDSNAPAWGSKYTININTEMNYWLAEPANLADCVAPLVSMIEELAASGARTARDMYGARGWVAHHNTDLWRATAPIDGAFWGLWPMGGAWLCLHLWDHYDYGRDRRFLDRVWPTMRDAALFFLDTLLPVPGTDLLVTNPSLSPENDHGHGGSLSAGPAMDMQILRDLFDRCERAGAILNRDAALCRQFAAARARLVPNQIGRDGQLMEWRDDWDADAPDPHHRHVSHLFALHPSDQINRDDTPALAAAARRSLETRGDASTGWGLAWRANLWARLGAGDRAHRVLASLLSSPRTYPNLFDAHPPFQIDGNFGGATAMIEMLVQSRGDLIDLLPALPAAWPSGSLRGIRVRGAAELDLDWNERGLRHCTIRPRIAGTRKVRCGARSETVMLRPGRTIELLGPGLDVRPA